jgi:cytochrome c oxidase subunit 2
MKRSLRLAVLAVLAFLAVLLAGCASNRSRQNVFEPEGQPADQIHTLTVLAAVMATIVGILVAAASVYIVIKYRRRKDDPDRLPEQVHGNTPLEIGWTIAPAVLLVVLAVPTVAVLFDLNNTDDAEMEIGVVGNQWWWEFTYDLDEDGETDIVTANEIVFPADTEVKLNITSNDVIHSFWIPQLNGKRDAVPGTVTEWKLQAWDPGLYWGHCTEFCGLAHGLMRMRAVSLSDADWEAWVERNMTPSEVPPEDTPEYAGYTLFGQHCATCHIIDGAYDTAADPSTVPLLTQVAPNLTHLTSRTSFAGSVFNLYLEDGSLNLGQLRDWIWDAPGQVPMAPDEERGMPSFLGILSAEDVDNIIAYLTTLDGEPPILPDGVPITGT